MTNKEQWKQLQVKYTKLYANADKYGKMDLHKYITCVNAISNHNCSVCDSYLPVFQENLLIIESQITEEGKLYGGNTIVKKHEISTMSIFTDLKMHLNRQHGFIWSGKYRSISLLLFVVILICCFLYGFWLQGISIGFLLFCVGGYLDYRNIKNGTAVM